MKTPSERHSFFHNVDLRAENKKLVTTWLHDRFTLAATEHDLTDSCQPYVRYQRNFLPEGRREYTGIAAVKAHLRYEAERVLDWEWTDLDVLTTDYPQIVWALADATYRVVATDRPSSNSFAFAFVLEDGKFRLIKEWLNPLPLLEERGVTVPSVGTAELFGD